MHKCVIAVYWTHLIVASVKHTDEEPYRLFFSLCYFPSYSYPAKTVLNASFSASGALSYVRVARIIINTELIVHAITSIKMH